MPTYEYSCEGCKKHFEKEQRITESPLKSCPLCKSRKVRRLISQGNFILKGSGWYSDLYNGASNEGASSKSGQDKDSKDSTKAESGGTGKDADGKKDSKKSEASSKKKSSKSKGKAEAKSAA